MTLAEDRLKELDNPSLTPDERTRLRCQLAADFIHGGRYEAAREALGELWRGIGERPNVEGLDERTAAEALLQAGALSSWMGASRQVAGAQAAAKDLISESVARFEALSETARAALARSDLALCYWREGAYDEARVWATRAVDESAEADAELRAVVLLRYVTVECAAGRLHNALEALKASAPAMDASSNQYLRGSFHNLYAVTLRRLGAAEAHGDYYDKAILEYTASIYHYGEARHERYGALIENNLAFLLHKMGRHADAHAHLGRARRVLARLNDAEGLAQVDETSARVLIAERKYREANRIISGAVQTLERGGDSAQLADALTVQGVVWARLEVYEGSAAALRRAMRLAEDAGALTSAAHAALSLIEEHGTSRLSQADAYNLYGRADELLKDSQATEDAARLRACARIVLRRLSGARLHDKDFSLYAAVHDFESKFIEQALEEAGGSVTRAAKLLGLGHQSFINILNNRHRQLLKKRTPRKRRLRSILPKN